MRIAVSLVLLTTGCSSQAEDGSVGEYERAVRQVLDDVEAGLEATSGQGRDSDAEQTRAQAELFRRAVRLLEGIVPPGKYEEGHRLLIRYHETSLQLFEHFARSYKIEEADLHDFRVRSEQLTVEMLSLLEEAGRELPFLEIGDLGTLATTDPGLIPDLRIAEVHYEVRLREGGRVHATVRYLLPDGTEEVERIRTPWSSPAFSFETGSTMRVEAEAAVPPPSNLDCVFVAENPAEGRYVYGPQQNLPEAECYGEYELGLWPPNDDDPINNPLIRVG